MIKHLRDSRGRYQRKTQWIPVIMGVCLIATIVWTLGGYGPDPIYASVQPVDLSKIKFICTNCEAVNWDELDELPDSKGVVEIPGIIAGYDIRRYATDPRHEELVEKIYNAMPGIKDAEDVDAYIAEKFGKSPVTGAMVVSASKKYGVDMRLGLAIMQQDSSFGTAGVGARTNNPGNIANYDNGSTFTYKTWQEGVNGVYRWLSRHTAK